MKHIGIIGVSAEGAALCFQTICSEAGKILGAFSHPEISIHEQSSKLYFDAQPNWEKVASLLLVSAERLKMIGADFAIIPSNTMHYAFPIVQKKSPIPLLSIVEMTVEECKEKNYRTVAILGTGLTMEGRLYQNALDIHNIQSILPDDNDRKIIDRIIFDEIVPAQITDSTSQRVLHVIDALKKRGADSVILGCTELPLVVGNHNSPLPIIDTTRLLARKAVQHAIT